VTAASALFHSSSPTDPSSTPALLAATTTLMALACLRCAWCLWNRPSARTWGTVAAMSGGMLIAHMVSKTVRCGGHAHESGSLWIGISAIDVGLGFLGFALASTVLVRLGRRSVRSRNEDRSPGTRATEDSLGQDYAPPSPRADRESRSRGASTLGDARVMQSLVRRMELALGQRG
jgi:hypothetical protein